MKFTRVGDWAEISECKRFTVALIQVNGRFTFEAWQCQPRQKLGTFTTIEEARQKCEQVAA